MQYFLDLWSIQFFDQDVHFCEAFCHDTLDAFRLALVKTKSFEEMNILIKGVLNVKLTHLLYVK